MIGLEKYVGEILDDKYRLEQLLGSGGMGAVYLATHLGTERYVALKLIAPQFMRNEEFVERFKREARAAGRLRHPNVVDVTDFGFATVTNGRVAYLVMEYLDGCTLGDVLAEEQRLPLDWVVDILEQVCSAVHEAHQQGIIHRDLKPDNIWLEPTRLGGYRVKVLDFGIAKLGEASVPILSDNSAATIIDGVTAVADEDAPAPTANSEKATLIQPLRDDGRTQRAAGGGGAAVKTAVYDSSEEAGTRIFAAKTGVHDAPNLTARFASQRDELHDSDGTLLFDNGTHSSGTRSAHATTAEAGSALTRVGAIMGTPLYMSPEQCSGGQIDMRSDIYSLGVIAYQMLAGEPPFSGNTSTVMRAHREESPTHLRERTTKIPKRVAGVVMSSLSKTPSERPATAFALASSLRGQAEGVGALYRRAFSLYSEYFPKFLKLSFLAHIPVIVTSILLSGMLILDHFLPPRGLGQKVAIIGVTALFGLLNVVAYFITTAVISGVTSIIVVQLGVAPLRPVKLRKAMAILRKRWRPFISTMIRVILRVFGGYLLCIVPGIIMQIRYTLWAPIVLIEGVEKKAALRRSRELCSRSWRTVIIVSILQFLIPMAVSMMVGRVRIGFGTMAKNSLEHQLSQQFLGLINIFIVPLISIVPALLYLKMRQLGGEHLSAALAQMEEVDARRSQWQQRMRTRLSLHTPITDKTSTTKE
ncbi:MAG TPA: serine/threonine-protein kinase [Pyrinomonadaceae bacterium]